MEARGAAAWKPGERERPVSPALRAYAAMTTSADTGAVRDVSPELNLATWVALGLTKSFTMGKMAWQNEGPSRDSTLDSYGNCCPANFSHFAPGLGLRC